MNVNTKIESTLAKYLEFKIFELFKNRLIPIIAPHCREGSKTDIYSHLFLCPATASKTRNFQLKGVLSPFVCLWRNTPIGWNPQFYGRSVLERWFEYPNKEGGVSAESGYLYDLEFDVDLFSSSYYRSFRDRVNIDLLDLDRLRYFNIDVKELFKNCSKMDSKIELMLNGIKQADNIDSKQNRSFDLTASYKIKATVPYCHGFDYIERLEVYLEENRIYYKEFSDVSSETTSS